MGLFYFFLTPSNQIWVTSLLNIPRLWHSCRVIGWCSPWLWERSRSKEDLSAWSNTRRCLRVILQRTLNWFFWFQITMGVEKIIFNWHCWCNLNYRIFFHILFMNNFFNAMIAIKVICAGTSLLLSIQICCRDVHVTKFFCQFSKPIIGYSYLMERMKPVLTIFFAREHLRVSKCNMLSTVLPYSLCMGSSQDSYRDFSSPSQRSIIIMQMMTSYQTEVK